MKIYKIDITNPKQYFKNLGTDTIGAKILANKTKLHTIVIKELHSAGANILKQDALSIGADLAVPRGTVLNLTKTVDVVLIATTKHLKILSKKEQSQPFGLKTVAQFLKNYIKPKEFETKIMGVINANDDSFFKNSRYKDEDAIIKIKTMIDDGAKIIDIGAVSSRPGSEAVNQIDELNRIKYICDTIRTTKLYQDVVFSIDSYTPSVVQYALDSGFKIVNDITGLSNDNIAKLVSSYDAKVVIMHMQGDPKTMQNNPIYDDVVYEVDQFFEQQIKKATKFGINDIILDVGIGFGKTLKHNLQLLQNMEHFKHFGCEILLGASRKSMIDMIVPNTPVEDRLSGTLAIHLDGIKKGASIIRTHDVKEHYQAIKVSQAISQGSI